MSHFSRIESKIKLKEALVAALERLELKPVEVHDRPVELINTWGDRATAEIVVRRQHLSCSRNNKCRSDLGFKWDEQLKCYIVLFDRSFEFRNSSLFDNFSTYQNFLERLQVAYEIASLPILYPENKFDISEEVQAQDGSYTFTITQKVDPFNLEIAGSVC